MINLDTLQQFCRVRDDCEPLWQHVPWSRGQYTYATNGHILIRLPRQVEVPENPRAVECDNLFPSMDGRTWFPLPVVVPPPLVECDDCEGRGKYGGPKGHVHQCDECEGTGKLMPIVRVAVGNAEFQQAYLALLGQLPNCQIAVTGSTTAAVIRFDGGEGLIMPLRP